MPTETFDSLSLQGILRLLLIPMLHNTIDTDVAGRKRLAVDRRLQCGGSKGGTTLVLSIHKTVSVHNATTVYTCISIM